MSDPILKCQKCGELLRLERWGLARSGSCPVCGATVTIEEAPPPMPPPPLPLAGPAPAVQASGHAVASLVLGILSIFPGLWLGGFITGTLAIIFSRIAENRIKAGDGRLGGRGLATAGLVTGIIGLSLSLLIILLIILFLGAGLTLIAGIIKAMLLMPK